MNVQCDLNRRTEADDSNAPRTERPEHSEYGPPPGYQPIILPGESISKYSRMAEPFPAAPAGERPLSGSRVACAPIAEVFADDEPIFAAASASSPGVAPEAQPDLYEKASPVHHESPADDTSSAWDREQQRLHQMNVAAVFGGEATRRG